MPPPAVVLDQVEYAYPGGPVALSGVSMSIEAGELVAIVGPNGGGKSMLVKLVLGLIEPARGRVEVFGEPARAAQRRGVVGFVPQRSAAELSFPLSARQVVEAAAAQRVPGWQRVPPEVARAVDESLERVGAASYAHRPIGALSGGQVQRVLIARALAVRPRILALDEPLVGVDMPGQRAFAVLLDGLKRELGLTILLVTHDLRTVAGGAATCDRVACLRTSLHFHAAPSGITPQLLAEVFQHDLAEVFGDVHVDAHRADACAAHGHGPLPAHHAVALKVDAPQRRDPAPRPPESPGA